MSIVYCHDCDKNIDTDYEDHECFDSPQSNVQQVNGRDISRAPVDTSHSEDKD